MSITCLDCPSLLTKDEADEFFKISSAGPMCARFGYVLGTGDKAAEAALSKYSENCAARGNDRPASEIKSLNFGQAYKPRPELLEPTGQVCSTCETCVNFDAGAQGCAAQGKMIFPERRLDEAAGCLWAKPDSGWRVHEEVGSILEHLTGSTVSVEVTSKPATTVAPKPKRRGAMKWPNAYDSDAPVSDEDKHMIRAWRQVDTRVGAIFLPIFRTDYFGDRAKDIPDPDASGGSDPSLYIDHAGLLEKFAVISYKKDMNLLLTGEPGTGKSEGVAWLAWMLNMPFERLPYTESSEPDQFLGSPQYGDTGEVDASGNAILGTYFKPGLLPLAWQRPGVLLSDEINLPTEAIQQAYRSMNDSARTLVVYDNKYRRHDYCFHLGAMNPSHDFRNIGARPMASADSSRWVYMNMPNPSADMIRKVITTQCKRLDGDDIDPFLVTTIVKIGEDLRQSSRDGRLPDFWTLRQEVKVARLAPYFGLMGAYGAAYLDYVDPNTKEMCETMIRSHMPSGPDWAN